MANILSGEIYKVFIEQLDIFKLKDQAFSMKLQILTDLHKESCVAELN